MRAADVDVAVIGAGVVGLACARELALRGRSVLLIERHGGFGRETSSRNSGVIHAGLHYAPGSWMETSCVEGRRRLYAYCVARDVPHRRTGKLVLAVEEEEVDALEAMARRGAAAGAGRLELWGAAKLRQREPRLRAACALFSPESGLVDAHALMATLLADAREAGCDVAFGSRVVELEAGDDGVRVIADTAGERSELRAAQLLNATGHGTTTLLRSLGVDVERAGLELQPVAGRYFALSAAAPRPEAALVYPLPSRGGLGIHLTRDLADQTRAGPDAAPGCTSLEVPEALSEHFAEAVARYLPGVRAEHLRPDFAGLRPRLVTRDAARDFRLVEGKTLGAPRTWHLLGIESPGLTASLALAEDVADAMG
ncbi:MAG: NAD(P)/FAD-dependent oxidoreductase [Deltaproteobacteria bacterium]|nr:NAD(P)/FAD-dependent oxidoreductase [Deltaproteobacteria bacterium]